MTISNIAWLSLLLGLLVLRWALDLDGPDWFDQILLVSVGTLSLIVFASALSWRLDVFLGSFVGADV